MNNDIITPAEAGKSVLPERTGQTIRLWCKDGLDHHKDGKGHILIKRSDLKKWCEKNGITYTGGESNE